MKAIRAADKAALDYQLRINEENMLKIMDERPELQVVILSDEERARFKELSKSLHEKYYEIVENAYAPDEKESARQGAQAILQSLLKEVQEEKTKS